MVIRNVVIQETLKELGNDLHSQVQTTNDSTTSVSPDTRELNPYDLVSAYDYYCHYTHFSPLFLQSNRKMIGLPSNQIIEGLIQETLPLIQIFLLVAEWHSAFKNFKCEDCLFLIQKLYDKNHYN